MKNKLVYLSFFLFSLSGNAQTLEDALRFSQINPGGTARFVGTGGSTSAIGGDFSAISTNPAGLGAFRRGQMTLTPSIRFANSKSTLEGAGNAAEKEQKSNFNFNSLGFVFNTSPRNFKWKSFNTAIGLNKLANFNNAYYYEGNSRGNIINEWFRSAGPYLNNGGSAEELYPFSEKLAVDAGAIYPFNNVYTYDMEGFENENIRRSQNLITSGAINEISLALAGNYDDQLSVGLSFGLPIIKYKQESVYKESNPDTIIPYFNNLTYNENLNTNGVGINVKMGLIYHVSKVTRVGLAFHTPTWMGLTDNYSTSLIYSYTDGDGFHAGDEYISPDGNTDYSLRTPWKANLNVGFILLEHGFISAEAEWVDYRNTRFNLTKDIDNDDNRAAERELNNQVNRELSGALNARIGAEARFFDVYRLRAGFNLLGNPYKDKTGFTNVFSFGGGVNKNDFYLDVAYRLNSGKGSISPYFDSVSQPIAATSNNAGDFLFTFGFRF